MCHTLTVPRCTWPFSRTGGTLGGFVLAPFGPFWPVADILPSPTALWLLRGRVVGGLGKWRLSLPPDMGPSVLGKSKGCKLLSFGAPTSAPHSPQSPHFREASSLPSVSPGGSSPSDSERAALVQFLRTDCFACRRPSCLLPVCPHPALTTPPSWQPELHPVPPETLELLLLVLPPYPTSTGSPSGALPKAPLAPFGPREAGPRSTRRDTLA